MKEHGVNDIIATYSAFINNKAFPCVGARAALAKKQATCMVAGHMACPQDDRSILQFLYDFVDVYRLSNGIFYSAAIIFEEPATLTEDVFDDLLWKRLQALANLDAEKYPYDKRVDADPASANFSFSIKEEAFFIIGLHPASNRASRQFGYPTLVFNPHAQFEKLKQTNKYELIRKVARKRDVAYSGSVNPMLDDFGKSSEAFQYSGRRYDDQWKCPLHVNHATNEHNPST
jgi:FPC/CPF motif-containing protein YcgG